MLQKIDYGRAFLAAFMLAVLAGLSGCGMFGPQSQGREVAAQYTGLADKSLAIVVYVPSATIDNYSGTREEISAFVTAQMRQHLPTTRLLNPRDVINWQNNTINWYALPEKDMGKHFSVDRVLYIEITDYSTKRTVGYSDLQGHLRARCKIFETNEAGNAAAWTGIVDVNWPTDRPLDPTQTNDAAVRVRTLELFAYDLVQYFYDHLDVGIAPRAR